MTRRGPVAQLAFAASAVGVGLVVAATGQVPEPSAPAEVSARPEPDPVHHPVEGRVDALVHRGADGRLDVVVVSGVPPSDDPAAAEVSGGGAEDGTLLLVPPSTLLEVPAFGPRTVAELGAGDEDLIATALRNGLGFDLDELVVLDDAALAAVFAPTRDLTLDLRRPARVRDGLGTLALARGEHRVPASDAVRLLTGISDDGELEQLVTVAAVVSAWRVALRDEEVAWSTMAVDPRLSGFVTSAARAVTAVTLPVDAVATGGAPRFAVRRAEVRDLVDDRLGWARLGSDGTRPRVELLNGSGAVGVTRSVAATVVDAGGEVTLTGNVAGFGVEASRVVHYRLDDAAVASEMARALGGLPVVMADRPIGVVDVTVVIGADWAPTAPS